MKLEDRLEENRKKLQELLSQREAVATRLTEVTNQIIRTDAQIQLLEELVNEKIKVKPKED